MQNLAATGLPVLVALVLGASTVAVCTALAGNNKDEFSRVPMEDAGAPPRDQGIAVERVLTFPPPADAIAPPQEMEAGNQIRFEDVTELIPSNFPKGFYFGCSWIDLDGDGDLDLTIPSDSDLDGVLKVWRNTPRGFEDMTAELGLVGIRFARAAAWVDLDRDDDLDLYVSRRSSTDRNLLFENVGGVMTLLDDSTGLAIPANDVAQAWADFDLDGDLDVYLAGTIVAASRLMRNEGRFLFVNVTEEVGIETDFPAISAAWADYDLNGYPDIALGSQSEVRIYQNLGGKFRDDTGDIFSPTALLVFPSWADMNNDGQIDLLLGGMNPPRVFQNVGPTAFVLEPGGRFVDRTEEWGSGFFVGKGGVWADLDLDGDLDLLDDGGSETTKIYENRINENLGLVLVEDSGLPIVPGISWHPVPGDFDNDGLTDFFEPHETESRLYRNLSPAKGRAIRIRLEPAPGQTAIGSSVRLSNELGIQLRHLTWPATGFAFASTDVILSSGKRGAAPKVLVKWASGLLEEFAGVTTNRLNTLQEGRGHKVIKSASGRGVRPMTNEPEPSRITSSCNPCRGLASFSLAGSVPHGSRIEIFDARGRLVISLPIQSDKTVWNLREANGTRVAPGVYHVRSRAADQALHSVRIVVLP